MDSFRWLSIENHFPLYCFSLGSDRVVRPALTLYAAIRVDGVAGDDTLVRLPQILKSRLELNGSRYSPLKDDQ